MNEVFYDFCNFPEQPKTREEDLGEVRPFWPREYVRSFYFD